jgi:ABC-2 type transport system ATP-binding protein
MQISLKNVGKRFNREWIFRHCNYQFHQGKSYAITGSNGSGKSTLLQVIAGALTHSEGSIECNDGGDLIPDKQAANTSIQYPASSIQHPVSSIQHPVSSIQHPVSSINLYQYVSIAAPYLELVEEMTAKEMLHFHTQFKPLIDSVSHNEILKIVGLENAANKQVRYYSSGMKQRLKLAQAFFSNSPVLLLDEPTTNLDSDGIVLYQQLIGHYSSNKLVIVSSNDKQEYDFCKEVIAIADFKS